MLSKDREGAFASSLHRVGNRLASAGRRAAAGAIPRARAAASQAPAFARASPIRLLAYLLAVFSFLFMAFPGIDLVVSGWFAAPGGGFPLAENDTLVLVRDVNRKIPAILIASLVAALILHAFRLHAFRQRASWLVRPHQALYVIAVYAVGGGIFVHLLKNVVGRARPEDIVFFGGTDAYTVAWQLSGACARNCSFSSGEAASAIAMLAAVVLVPKLLRPALLVLLVPLAALFSLNRIAFGSHFLSDVVVSWLIVSIVAVALWRRFRAKAEAIDRAVIGSGLPLAAAVARLVAKATAAGRPGAPIPPA